LKNQPGDRATTMCNGPNQKSVKLFSMMFCKQNSNDSWNAL